MCKDREQTNNYHIKRFIREEIQPIIHRLNDDIRAAKSTRTLRVRPAYLDSAPRIESLISEMGQQARVYHIAKCEILGTPYNMIERTTRDEKSYVDLIRSLALKKELDWKIECERKKRIRGCALASAKHPCQ